MNCSDLKVCCSVLLNCLPGCYVWATSHISHIYMPEKLSFKADIQNISNIFYWSWSWFAVKLSFWIKRNESITLIIKLLTKCHCFQSLNFLSDLFFLKAGKCPEGGNERFSYKLASSQKGTFSVCCPLSPCCLPLRFYFFYFEVFIFIIINAYKLQVWIKMAWLGMTLLKEVCHWGWTLMSHMHKPCPVRQPLLAASGSRCRTFSYLCSTTLPCLLPWW